MTEHFNYERLYEKYKKKYEELKERLNDPNYLKLKEWPKNACDNSLIDEIEIF